MGFGIQSFLRRNRLALITGCIAFGGVLSLRLLGTFQLLELRGFDWMLRLRPTEATDERILIIGITESDLNWLGASVLTDQVMADLITQLKGHNPRIIGLDFYRNLPIEPGSEALAEVFKHTPNLIGIEKVISDGETSKLPGNTILAETGQVAASDVLVDADGRVRRGLLFPSAVGPRAIEGFGFRLALDYLFAEGIQPEPDPDVLRLGAGSFHPVDSNDGGYVRTDDGGYQILLNMRTVGTFDQLTLQEVLSGEFSPKLVEDRIVLIGSAAISSSDIFYTAYSSAFGPQVRTTFGVEIHAHITSQIISTVLDGRPSIHMLPEWAEALAILLFAYIGVGLQLQETGESRQISRLIGVLLVTVGSGYLTLLLWGWWLPIVPSIISTLTATMITGFYRTKQLKTLSAEDRLTRLANRRTFDETLQREWFRALRSQTPLSLIICDVDFFKAYNDTYGHPKGDECLTQVAKAMKSAVKWPDSLVARYGGEEFVVLLPSAESNDALKIAEAIRERIKGQKIIHEGSKVSEVVTLSLGVTSFVPSMNMPTSALVEIADLGLYTAKQAGRDRAVLHLPDTFAKPALGEN
ncbi:MAG: CHASE2 domain-containing protein [Cyanobacteria bacterium J06635_1]